MQETQAPEAVPQDVAYQICADIRAENRRQWYTVVSPLWCWGCVTFTKGDRDKMCGAVVSCPQVLARYTEQQQ